MVTEPAQCVTSVTSADDSATGPDGTKTSSLWQRARLSSTSAPNTPGGVEAIAGPVNYACMSECWNRHVAHHSTPQCSQGYGQGMQVTCRLVLTDARLVALFFFLALFAVAQAADSKKPNYVPHPASDLVCRPFGVCEPCPVDDVGLAALQRDWQLLTSSWTSRSVSRSVTEGCYTVSRQTRRMTPTRPARCPRGSHAARSSSWSRESSTSSS